MKGWFSRTRLVLAIAFIALLFWSSGRVVQAGYQWLAALSDDQIQSPYRALSLEEEVRCGNVTRDTIINAAIGRYVNAGITHENSGQQAENKSWRYTSSANFKDINPACCSVLAHIPGDYPLQTQRQGAPYLAPPRLYAVKMAFKEWQGNDRTATKHDVVLVDCFGKAGGGVSFDLHRGIF